MLNNRFSGAADDRRRREGADAEHAERRRHRRAGHGLQRRLGRVRQHPLHEAALKEYKIGDKLELIVPHCDPVVNEYNQMYGIRKGKVEVVWDVTGTGLLAVKGSRVQGSKF